MGLPKTPYPYFLVLFLSVFLMVSKCIRYGTEFEVFIQELLEPLEKDMSEEEIETVKEIAYVAAHSAERYGFKLGARFMAKLLQEVFEMPE